MDVGPVAALRWASKRNGEKLSALNSSFDTIKRSYAYRKWVKGRPNINNLPGFAFYRPSINSRIINAQVALSIGPYLPRVQALLSEIQIQGFDLIPGQIVFHGRALSAPPHGRICFKTFLSTSISPSVAACHARDHACWRASRAYVFVISTAIPTKALWGQFRSFDEFELLFQPGAALNVHRVHQINGGLYDIVEAELIGFA